MKNRTVNTVCLVALALTVLCGVFLLVLLSAGSFSACFKEGENLGEGLGQACSAIITIFIAVFGLVVELLALFVATPAVISGKKRAPVIACSVISSLLYAVAIFLFVTMFCAIVKGGGDASVIALCSVSLALNCAACLYAIVAFILLAVVKSKNAKADGVLENTLNETENEDK